MPEERLQIYCDVITRRKWIFFTYSFQPFQTLVMKNVQKWKNYEKDIYAMNPTYKFVCVH